MNAHDPLCPNRFAPPGKSVPAPCSLCALIRHGRESGLRMALDAVDANGRASAQISALLKEALL